MVGTDDGFEVVEVTDVSFDVVLTEYVPTGMDDEDAAGVEYAGGRSCKRNVWKKQKQKHSQV